ncbi:BnaC09g33660D [Brassica napus]|uniref:Formin-like protein n=1 Tax=Brassica napus TaxID=3708 RepID=A0A078I1A5_BRANA|nr:BnaC09g33660D [Brassica napus]
MALFRKLFYRKPPDGLLEICDRVFVFDCCFSSDSWEEENYKVYMAGVVNQLQEHFPDVSSLVFNFREVGTRSVMADVLSEHGLTIMDYPRHYEGCSLLPVEVMHHFLRSSESWLSLGPSNLLLMHCERGAWPVLAFMLAALLIYRKQYSGELKTLDMIYKQAPRELLQLFSPLNPIPSQCRYLQYVSRRNLVSEWPPLDRALTMDCVILRFVPDVSGQGGCRPIFRVYGQDPLFVDDKKPKLLYSTPKKGKHLRVYKQAECELVKIDINCHVQGDIVIECLSLNDDLVREVMLFRVVFNTAFIRSNILMLNRDEVDTLWHIKDQFPKGFRVELLFSDMDAASSVDVMDFSCLEEKDGLPIEVFSKVQELFNQVDWADQTDATRNMLQHLAIANAVHERPEGGNSSPRLQGLSPKSIHDLVKQAAMDSNAKLKLSSVSEVETVDSPEKQPTGTAKNFIAEDTHSVLQISGQDATKLSGQESPSLKLVHHSATVKPFVDGSEFSEKAEENNGKVVSFASSTPSLPHPTITSLAPVAAPPPPSPPPVPTVASQPSEKLQHSVVQPAETVSQGNSWVSLAGSTFHQTTPNEKHPVTLPPTSLASDVSPQESSRITKSSSVLPSATLSAGPTKPSQAETSGSFCPASPPIGAPNDVASPLGQPARLPPPVSKSDKTHGLPQPPPPPPPTPPPMQYSDQNIVAAVSPPIPSPAPAIAASPVSNSDKTHGLPRPPPPPPPPSPMQHSDENTVARLTSCTSTASCSSSPSKRTTSTRSDEGTMRSPSAPPPPPKLGTKSSPSSGTGVPPTPALPGGSLSSGKGRMLRVNSKNTAKKLKPYHWLKLTRAVNGSLWAETQMSSEASKAPEIDMTELESLFSSAPEEAGKSRLNSSRGPKPEKVQLIEHRRAYNCEIMLSKVKVPLQDLMYSVLNLEESALDADQVENLIKFCPTREEMELLKGYTGDVDKLGKCELFFLEMMKVPRVETKLRVFSFKIQFRSQISELKNSLSVVNSAAEQIKNSEKFKRIMQTVLSLGNALNQGTARGAAVGFKLDSLPKLSETRARNNRMTLMHYLCKILAEKMPEVLDFTKDLSSLEPSTKIQLKFLAEEMQAINKGLEKVVQELSLSENDGPISHNFNKILKEFLLYAEAEVRSLASLYSGVGRNVDGLILYFGEDPAKCPFEQVVSTLLNFVSLFNRAHEENGKQLEAEAKKKAEDEKSKISEVDKESRKPLSLEEQVKKEKTKIMVSTLLNFVRLFNRAHEENGKQLEAEAKKKAEDEKSKISEVDKESRKPLSLEEQVKKEKTKISGFDKETKETLDEGTPA